MKRIWILLLVLILSFAMVASALGAAGDSSDPVVSLSYVDQVLKPELTAQYQKLVDQGLNRTWSQQFSALVDSVGAARLAAQRADRVSHAAQGNMILKKGDIFTLAPGAKAQLLDGSVSTDTSYLIDVTNGKRVTKGTALQKKTLYMMADSSSGDLAVDSDTAELNVNGVYTLTASGATDYGSLAEALHVMGLFRGTGSGYALEAGATRAQGLVMFLRILGLEDEAIAYTGSCPFTDVAPSNWAYRYVAYAYHSGLTSGTSVAAFSPDAAITCQHYVTFLLRALHYQENTDFTYAASLENAASLGLFSQKELSVLSAGAFRRSRMVYLSYYGLFGVDQQAQRLLLTSLAESGAVAQSALSDGICRVRGKRIA